MDAVLPTTSTKSAISKLLRQLSAVLQSATRLPSTKAVKTTMKPRVSSQSAFQQPGVLDCQTFLV